MSWSLKGCGAGFVRRLRATCAMALALALFGGAAGGEGRAEAAEMRAPLTYHATIVNGRITGSSFQIADGIGVTNAHVVENARPGTEILALVEHGGTRLTARARVLAVSRVMDLALIALPPGLLPTAPGRDAPLGLGRTITAAGVIAQATGPGARMELPGAIASPIVTVAPFGPGLIATMPGIRRGFSGGPVFDDEGRLVGMIAALRPDPGPIRSAAGTPMAGEEAFVLAAPAVREEAARLLAGLSGR